MAGAVLPGWRLAIDFGTTNTAAAVEHRGQVSPLRLDGGDVMRSAVLVEGAEIKTGNAAVRSAALHPTGYEPTPKRRLGEDRVLLGGSMHEPVDFVAAVLRKVYAVALADADDQPPEQVVLTHPQAWRAHRVGLLRQAALQAGIPASALRFLAEPVATAWHHAGTDPLPAGTYVAVLDLGGGTCDIALLHVREDAGCTRIEVVDSDGIDPLGGQDFDAAVEGWVRRHLLADRGAELIAELDEPRQIRERLILRDGVRTAKESLSETQAETIGVQVGDHQWVGTITRTEYEELIAADIGRSVDLLQQVLGRSLPSGASLHRLYLTGGSSLTPLLQQRLEELYPGRLGRRAERKQVTAAGALQAPESAMVDADLDSADEASRPDPAFSPAEESALAHSHLDASPLSTAEPRSGQPWTKIAAIAGAGVVVVAAGAFALSALGGDNTSDASLSSPAGGSVLPGEGSGLAGEGAGRAPGDTPDDPPATGRAIDSTEAMLQLVADHQLALRSSCSPHASESEEVLVFLSCSDPLTDQPATLSIYSYGSTGDFQAAVESFEEGWLLLGEVNTAPTEDGVVMLMRPRSGDAMVAWSDESTMTVSSLYSGDTSADELYQHWLTTAPDY